MKPGLGYWMNFNKTSYLAYPGYGVPIDFDFYNGGISLLKTVNNTNHQTSRNFIVAYGDNITIDNQELAEGSLVEFYTNNDIKCGEGQYREGLLKFTSIYGYDEADENTFHLVGPGETVQVHINGERVYPDLTWEEPGAQVRLSILTTTGLPASFALAQNYPNPFNPATVISFDLPYRDQVSLTIYNIIGQEVISLIDNDLPAGRHQITWDSRDVSGEKVSSGVYLYRLETSDYLATKKMVLMK